MKVIVAGSRSIVDYRVVWDAIDRSGFDITELVSGHARGVDVLAEDWAKKAGVPVRLFPVPPSEWRAYGGYAGPLRNRRMASYVGPQGGLLAIWDGYSRGTGDMIKVARDLELRVVIETTR